MNITDKQPRAKYGSIKERVVNMQPGQSITIGLRELKSMKAAARTTGIRLTAKPFFTPAVGWQYNVQLNTEAKS